MNDVAQQYKVGFFVMSGVGLLILALLAFGIRGRFEPKDHFETYVEGDVDGLAVGSAVKLRGVDVGRVTSIDFSWRKYPPGSPNCIVVAFDVRQKLAPPMSVDHEQGLASEQTSGLRAIVKSNGITGTSILSLEFMDAKQYPPLVFPWAPQNPYIPSAPSQLGRIMDAVTKTAGNLEKVDFTEVVGKVDLVLDTLTEKLDAVDTAGLNTRTDTALRDLHGTLGEISRLATDTRHQIDSLQLEAIAKHTDALLAELGGDSQSLKLTLDRLGQVDVRSLNETLDQSRAAVGDFSDAVSQLKRSPSTFLFGDAPPPVSVVDPASKRGER